MTTDVTHDFIFGTLATDDLRLDALRAAGRGLFHGNRIDPSDPEPNEPVRVTVSAGADINAATVVAYYTIDSSDPSPDAADIALTPGEVVWDTLLWAYRREWHGAMPPQPENTLVRYRIAADGADGTRVWAEPDVSTGAAATFAYHVDRERVPEWVRDAVIYQVFIDRFSPGADRDWKPASSLNDIWGGTIRGVIEALPYLESLGVTCLWLSPLFPSPTHHGYDATDYLTVEPRLGTESDLAELVEAAHARGMRVLLDFVANHISDQHPAFVRASADPAAPERDWLTYGDWPAGYQSFFGVTSMPQLNLEQSGARDYLLNAAAYWLRQGVDGYRLDYANGPSHAFWTMFRAATRAVRPDSFTVGEVVETAELQRTYQGRLDGTLDFLLLQQMRAFFAFETIGASAFAGFLDRHLAYFPPDVFVLPSFLDNHDMNRFLWVVRGDKRRLKLAALWQLTLPHPPVIYYGTEIGLSQRHDLEYPDGSRRMEESRTLMPRGADQDADLLRFYTALIAVRRGHPALWRGPRTTLALDDAGLLVVRITGPEHSAVVALNRTATARHVDLPRGLSLVLTTDDWVGYFNGGVDLPPMTGALLTGPS